MYQGGYDPNKDYEVLYETDLKFTIFMALKILRLCHLDEVQDAFTRLFDKLGEIFYLQKYRFMNLLSWFLTGLKFLLCIHYLACGWIIIFLVKDIEGVLAVEFLGTTIMDRYAEALYLITTTITTVGYGDYKAFNDTSGIWFAEMCYLFFVTLAGTLLFTTVTRQVFDYKMLMSLDKIVSEQCQDMEEYLYNISGVRKDKNLGKHEITTSLEHMEECIRSSTRFHFEDNHFYQELPQRLKRKLVNTALLRQKKTFQFFFEDFAGKNKASEAFII